MKKKRARVPGLVLLAALALGIGTGGAVSAAMGGADTAPQAPVPHYTNEAPSAAAPQIPAATVQPLGYQPLPLPEEMRAMWISFLEWRDLFAGIQGDAQDPGDLFAQRVGEMFQNCKDMGLNTVIVAVRPFGDALYQSQLFPWSHLATGTQGQPPGYDPLSIMAEQAHQRDLRLEAWINPYRVNHPQNGPGTLSADNPASANPDWVRHVEGEQWYDPGLPSVEDLVVQGVAEILQKYAVDGIHFDDYFYPSGATEEFDSDSYARQGGGKTLADWRRDNTGRMVQRVYAAVKMASPGASFGISMQGNNENNFTTMYADVKKWMAGEGYVDYVMPQLYWGFNYRTKSGRESYAFANICDEWAFYPRQDNVRLYAGLGAYRLGEYSAETDARTEFGDGGNNEQTEWESGHNLADMVMHTRSVDGFSGFALFRYHYLYQEGDVLSGQERDALVQLLGQSQQLVSDAVKK